MRKVDDGEKKEKKEKKKKKENNDVYSGHYVIASRPPERRPTGTPHARAKKLVLLSIFYYIIWHQFISCVLGHEILIENISTILM